MQQPLSFRPSPVSAKSNVPSFPLRQRKFWASAAIVLFAVLFALAPLPARAVTAGIISTYAGDGTAGYSGDAHSAISAELDLPQATAVDAAGNLYIADSYNNVVRKVTPGGIISTFAGNNALGSGYSGDGDAATSAQLNGPTGVASDATGDIYIADRSNCVIRKVVPDGKISTVAGDNAQGCGYAGDDGSATTARLNYPFNVALDAAGNLYIADSNNHLIRKVTTSGIISTFAGNYALGSGYSGDGAAATSAQLNNPQSVTLDTAGNIYIADTNNNVIRKVTTSGKISTVAGNYAAGGGYSGDSGSATKAQLNAPDGVSVDGASNIYIADWDNNVIRKVTTGGIISTVAGNYALGGGDSGDGHPATAAQLNNPHYVAFDAAGNGYIADANNNVIREVALLGVPIPTAPAITSLSPSSTVAGGESFILRIHGTNFAVPEVVKWGTTALTVTYASATELEATVLASLIETAGTAKVTVTTDKGTSAAATFTINPPLPTITSLSPSSTVAGGESFILTIDGTNFTSAAVVKWGTTALTVTYASATELEATVLASLIETAGTAKVTVTTDKGTSAAATFTINPPLPTITSLSPSSTVAGGGSFILTIDGTNFTSAAVVKWGTTALTVTYASATELEATVLASLIETAGTAKVTVTTDKGTSAAKTFTINPPLPTITSLSPSSTVAGGESFILTIDGTNFTSAAVVKWGTTALTVTYASATELEATVLASLIETAGTAKVTVTTDKGTSAAKTFTINPPLPTITSLSPSSTVAGGESFILRIHGTNFAVPEVVKWGTTALTVTYASATELEATVLASLIETAGTAKVTVTTDKGTSAAATFTINPPLPTITSLSPSSTVAGGESFILTIDGTNFTSAAVVKWGTTALTVTYVSATKLEATVLASLIETAGTAKVTVTTDKGTSAAKTFTIHPPPPAIATLSPNSVTHDGAAFTLTINGTNFFSGAEAKWGTTGLKTTYVSATKLTATVPASLITTAGTAKVTVTTAGGTSAAVTFTIN